jgi:importin subunit alpha-1
MAHRAVAVATPALRTAGLIWFGASFRFVPTRCVAGNIVTGDDSLTEVLVQAGILPKLTLLLSHARTTICKEAAWALSNITAGLCLLF